MIQEVTTSVNCLFWTAVNAGLESSRIAFKNAVTSSLQGVIERKTYVRCSTATICELSLFGWLAPKASRLSFENSTEPVYAFFMVSPMTTDRRYTMFDYVELAHTLDNVTAAVWDT